MPNLNTSKIRWAFLEDSLGVPRLKAGRAFRGSAGPFPRHCLTATAAPPLQSLTHPLFIPTNAGLFHYAGNNPVRYIDPDGRLVYKKMNSVVSDALDYLYKNSPTFKKQFDKLLSDKNGIDQKFIVIFSTDKAEYAGNVTTNDSPIDLEIKTFGLDDKGNIITVTEQKTDKEIQGIFINIDLSRITAKKLNLYEVISEEVCHASDCMSYGANAWTEKCKAEDKNYDYSNRPREKYAKELTKIILQEIKNEN